MAGSHESDMNLAIILFGFFLGLFLFTSMKVARQTWSIWKRTKSVWNIYVWMIWIEVLVNFVFAATTYMFLQAIIPPSLAYYIAAVTLWMIQTQLLLQIIANRVSLIMVNRQKSQLLRWALFGVIGCVNVSVYCIWIPAQMGTNEEFVKLNKIWERVEKTIFLLTDFGLNFYFLHLVRSRLISKGLTKYSRLFNMNAALVLVSVAMDALLLGMLSLPNEFTYVQFAPVAYTVKLNIELTMAELISKVVRSSQRVDGQDVSNPTVVGSDTATRNNDGNKMRDSRGYFPGSAEKAAEVVYTEMAETHVQSPQVDLYSGEGIMKTVTTRMKAENHSFLEDSSSGETTVEEPTATG